MKHQEIERRSDERVSAELPVDIGGTTCKTRNISASGLFFETDVACAVDRMISLAVEVTTPGSKKIWKCQGNIVRVEHRDGKIGVAVKIIDSLMEQE